MVACAGTASLGSLNTIPVWTGHVFSVRALSVDPGVASTCGLLGVRMLLWACRLCLCFQSPADGIGDQVAVLGRIPSAFSRARRPLAGRAFSPLCTDVVKHGVAEGAALWEPAVPAVASLGVWGHSAHSSS